MDALSPKPSLLPRGTKLTISKPGDPFEGREATVIRYLDYSRSYAVRLDKGGVWFVQA